MLGVLSRSLALGWLVACFGCLLFVPVNADAALLQCGNLAFGRNGEDGAYEIRTTMSSCKVARRVARAVRPLGVTRGPYEYRQSGFRCRGHYKSAGLPRVEWSCRRGTARIFFTRA